MLMNETICWIFKTLCQGYFMERHKYKTDLFCSRLPFLRFRYYVSFITAHSIGIGKKPRRCASISSQGQAIEEKAFKGLKAHSTFLITNPSSKQICDKFSEGPTRAKRL